MSDWEGRSVRRLYKNPTGRLTVIVHNLFDISHNLGITSLGPCGRGIYRLASGLEYGSGLGVQHKRDG